MKRLFLLCVITALMLTGCAGGAMERAEAPAEMKSIAGAGYSNSAVMDDYAAAEEVYDMEESAEAVEINGSDAAAGSTYDAAAKSHGKKLIHNYDMTVQTQEFEELTVSIAEKIEELGGYIESSNKSNYSDSRNMRLTIRLPQENAQKLLDFVGDSGNVTNQSENVTDKTLSYADMEGRMKSYKEELKTLEELSRRAETVEDLLSIESAMADVRAEIESYQSQLNVIDDRVNFATINLYVDEVKTYTYSEPGFFDIIAEGLSDDLDKIKYMISDFIIGAPVFLVGLLLFLIPFSIVIFVLVRVYRLLVKKTGFKNPFKRKKSADNAQDVVVDENDK